MSVRVKVKETWWGVVKKYWQWDVYGETQAVRCL